MKRKKEMLAMLLAGGQGSRLYVLTQELAKPAVPFGGKYRIIDFTLSNCINSHIDTIGVLTQYKPLLLNSYIGNGQPWDLDRINGGVTILQPFMSADLGHWYKGTANAIFQNITFIEQYNPDYVLILSGDHIYKMDYDKMLKYHKEKGADATIAVLNVPIDQASRFGIMNTDDDNKVLEFQEKPEHPISTKASMGVYIFTWEKLRHYLIKDEETAGSSNDFGKNIIPDMLNSGEKMFAYAFDGYWKDVGTIESLWEANMDLLDPKMININDSKWRIYGRNSGSRPHYIGDTATISNSLITEGGEINGNVSDSVISSDVVIEEGANISFSVIMKGARIKKGAIIKYAIIADDAVIGENAVVGKAPEEKDDDEVWGIAVVGRGAKVSDNCVVKMGDKIEPEVIVKEGK
ncbi:MAG: glucose-1-phosphate adenylyltransferase [Clostridia bacterium]